MPTTLYIIRHGETEDNAMRVFQGQTHGRLLATGKNQAQELCALLSSIEYDAVLCSDLKRCIDTAEIALGSNAGVIRTTPLLRERDMGNLTGRKMDGATLNETVENDEKVGNRAEEFLRFINENYANKKILVFSHGFFLKILQSKIEKKSQHEIAIMKNCEIRKLIL